MKRFSTNSSFRRPRRLFAALGLLSLMGVGAGCGSGSKAAQAEAPHAVAVKVQPAKLVPIKDSSEYVATLKSRGTAVIMPEVDGRITRIFVHSGQRVTAGTPLMQIDPAKQTATLSSQQNAYSAQLANVQFAQQQYDRTSKLYQSGVSSKQEFDQASSALDAAKAQLSSLDAQVHEQRVQLHYYRVSAPRDGVVGDIPVRAGDRVTSSTALTTVDQPGSLEVYVYVPIERAGDLHLNLPVELLDSARHVIGNSRITFISPQVDNTTQTVLAKATIPNNQDKLRNAQFTRARVIWGTQDKTTVPVLAVTRIGGQYFVFVAETQDGKLVAHQRPLKIGDIVGNDYVVLDGLKPGDKVIVSGTQFLVDGAPVAEQA
ncbi:MAG: efflux RND transporter periplasmic adaptor subunit [Acidobacteriales bacterium]|nr:efflux RND transporter periplasmic adaptor subunit [Terriglobales bacterium]